MKLSRLEIFGFKTFAKKLDIRLSEGVTAVVGPNGCGKTNVVDAIRWVLGEQRPTQIRLERMEDVIFKGSPTRKQLGMAEVSLTIENESGRLPVNLPEITITRRLFRSGESEYLLNKKISRLADINDLFMDTGMGTDSYSVFELAMINSILSDKTEDRRHIFEEAAGVTKYKNRRRLALNRMITIEDDLARVGDIVTELDRRVDSLRRQAQKAARYRSLRSELKARTIGIGAFEIGRFRKRKETASEELETARTLGGSLRERIGTFSEETDRLAIDVIDAERALSECGGRFEVVRSAAAERGKELARLDARIEHLEGTAVRAREESRRTAAAIEEIAESHGRCGEALGTAVTRLGEVARTAEEFRAKLGEVEDIAAKKNELSRSLETEHRLLEHDESSARSAIAAVRARRESGETRFVEIALRIAELEAAAAETDRDRERFGERRLRDAALVEERERALDGLRTALSGLAAEIEALDQDLRAIRGRETSLRAERDFLSEVLAGFAGYSEGVRNAAAADCLRNRVIGVLADHISTDEPYLRAVGAALSDSLHALVVADRDAALDGARHLASGLFGRAVLLPLESGEKGEKGIQLFHDPGVLGPVYAFVRAESAVFPLVRRLLEDVVVVDGLETAVRLRTISGKGRFVTLDGTMIGSHGELHAGTSSDGAGTTLGRREALERIAAEHLSISAELDALERRRSEKAVEAERLRADIRGGEQALDELRRSVSTHAGEEAGAAARRDAALGTLSALKKEADALSGSFEGLEKEIAAVEARTAGFEEKRGILEERMREVAAETGEIRSNVEAHRARLNACEVERAALLEKKSALEREIASAEDRRASLARTGRNLQTESEEAEQGMLVAGERKQALLLELGALETEEAGLVVEKDGLDRRVADLRARKSEIERQLATLRREQADINRRESELTLERDEAELRIRTIVERLADEFFLAPHEIPDPPSDPDFDPENERLLAEDLKRKIHALGDVNMAAEADFREEKERLDFLVNERDDLMKARQTIEETIRRINHIARERFRETFERIRENFSKTFADFFEGGFCDLTLDEGADPLEADILITARPPGKNVRTINLLSSGERALTAISLLFAIYLVKPSPFCILDEVDAPLDDANIDRFLRVIREFSRSTQFIMVTHNKKTMASADTLHGITMEEPGLSTLVSVRLSKTGAAGTRVEAEPECRPEPVPEV